MKITFFGTTTLLFDDGQDQVLFDAHLTRPSLARYLLGKGRTDTAAADAMIRRHRIKRLRAVFISHSHHDHVMDLPYLANRTGAQVYGSTSACNVARGGRVPEEKLTVFSGNETFSVGKFRVTVIPSLHSKPTAFNNDLGQTIDQPLVQPARLRADVLFLGIAGLAKADRVTEEKFFAETVEKVRPELVIPIHWDNFFTGLNRPVRGMPHLIERTEIALFRLTRYCEARDADLTVMLPRTHISHDSFTK